MITEILKVKPADFSSDLAVQKNLAMEQASKDVQVLQVKQGPGISVSKLESERRSVSEVLASCSLKGHPMKLRTYTGDFVKPTGFCSVTVQNRGQSEEPPIYVMKNEGPALFG